MSDTDVTDEHPAFDLLRCGVPIALLMDLALPVDSLAICRAEPPDLAWVPAGTG